MEKLLQDISIIINEGNNNINEKIFGINYLEKLKYILIDKFKDLDMPSINNNAKSSISEVLNNHLRESLSISINNNMDSISKLNFSLENTSLFLILRGSLSIEISNEFNTKKLPFLNLYNNTGLVVEKNSKVNQLISKESIIITISILDEKNIEKK